MNAKSRRIIQSLVNDGLFDSADLDVEDTDRFSERVIATRHTAGYGERLGVVRTDGTRVVGRMVEWTPGMLSLQTEHAGQVGIPTPQVDVVVSFDRG